MAGNDLLREPGGAAPVLDLAFDSGTLGVLRAEVGAGARQAGLPEARAQDVVLAVHELAANAVQHGAGGGRLRMWTFAGALRCEVDDGHPGAAGDPCGQRADPAASEGAGVADAYGSVPAPSWPNRPGHGLWVVRQVADRMRVLLGARGTRAMVAFDLPHAHTLRQRASHSP
jgi:two-component sensor histidine kinase